MAREDEGRHPANVAEAQAVLQPGDAASSRSATAVQASAAERPAMSASRAVIAFAECDRQRSLTWL